MNPYQTTCATTVYLRASRLRCPALAPLLAYLTAILGSAYKHVVKHRQALDFILYVCRQAGIKALLALGNSWSMYKGPEDFLAMATGSSGMPQHD